MRVGGFELRLCLRELDLIGAGIDHEEQVALLDDLPVLKMQFRECPPNLRAQLNAINGRELAEEADLRIDLALQWRTHGHLREWSSGLSRMLAAAIAKAEPGDARERRGADTDDPGPSDPAAARGDRWLRFFELCGFACRVHSCHVILNVLVA